MRWIGVFLAAAALAQTPQTMRTAQQRLDEERRVNAERKRIELREYVRANYTKYEHLVPMRDGVRLFTSIYVPKLNTQKYPIMMMRTPYTVAPYGSDNYRAALGPSEPFAREGFIFVYQDVRGKGKSEGKFVHVRPYIPVKKSKTDVDESSDTYDTIDWLVKNIPENSGRVGLWGISYPGFYAAMGAVDAHPALKASSPQAPVTDWFVGDDFRHNGAIYLAHAFRFFSSFGRAKAEPGTIPGPEFDFGTPDSYDFYLRVGPLSNIDERHFKGQIEFWNDLMSHGTYDEFWQSRDMRRALKNMKPAMMTVGGWFDAEDLFGALNVYQSIERSSSGDTNTIVMGPWQHGGWSGEGDHLGNVRFGAKTGVFFREQIEYPFFLYHLKGKGEPAIPEAYMFETGTNQWRRYDAWPPREAAARKLYFAPEGKLTFTAPPDAGAFDEYVSDPAKPVPYIGYTATGMTPEYMLDDQRFASSRTDVLVYQTDPLEEDATIAGPIQASLEVSTTGTDSDWVVKLIDVYPGTYPDNDPDPEHMRMGGYQQLVRGEPFRGKFRNSYVLPEPFEPAKPVKVEFTLPDAYHTFRRGHRIMVHVQSSWFPLVDRNPQKFMDIFHAKAGDFQKATQRVYRSAKLPSAITVRWLK